MFHALPTVTSSVGHEAKPIGTKTRAQLCRSGHNVGDGGVVGVYDVAVRLAGNNENVNGGLRVVIPKRDAYLILMEKLDGHFAARDATKNGVFHKRTF